MSKGEYRRRLPVGAEVAPGGVQFRVWAPKHKRASVVIEFEEHIETPKYFELEPEHGGYFSGLVSDAEAGALYRFKLGDDENLYPDPASRYQPSGPHGPSQVIDPGRFEWSDEGWEGVKLEGAVIYEMHVGTFTRQGTWRAAMEEIEELAGLGITVIEMMPIGDFPGRFGWGYDGVDLFAPTRLHGGPDDLRAFINRAHEIGVGVILDVVYNHFGPDGNYLRAFSEDYFSSKYKNEWGEAINFDGANSGPVREFFISNARYWVEEFHFDGLRLDATQQMYDGSGRHVISQIVENVRRAGGKRSTLVIGENEPQKVMLVRPQREGGYGLDALWNDDFHHSAHVCLTGDNEAYYSDYLGKPQELLSAIKWGYLYQGQRSRWQSQPRGTSSLGLEKKRFVYYIQNHDQVANSAKGQRYHQLSSPGRYRAMTTLLLLGPGTVMLFMGQEFAASSPFMYFADHKPGLEEMVIKGRIEFLSQFASLATSEMTGLLPRPDERAFMLSKLDFAERVSHFETYALHKELLRIRREDEVFSRQGQDGLDGAVIGAEALILRFFGADGDDRLMLVNFGTDIAMAAAAEPLLAPVEGCTWEMMFSSDDPAFGGGGTRPIFGDFGWMIPGRCAVVLKAVKEQQ